MPRQLTITPAPYKSSFLAIPPTPFSPLLPITPPASPPRNYQPNTRAAKLKDSAELLPPPPESLHWLWQCHKCNRVYQLGVTRRCLDDGHFFCAGTTVVKRNKKAGHGSSKKVIRHAACASEFDYQGWKSWGNWRRAILERVEAAEALIDAEEEFERTYPGNGVIPEGKWFQGRWSTKSPEGKGKKSTKKDCWMRCDYPSECRWGKQFGVQSPTTTTSASTKQASVTVPSTSNPESQKSSLDDNIFPPKTATSFEEILGLVDSSSSGDIADETPEPDYLEPLSPMKSSSQKSLTDAETKSVSMDDLLESVKRRKRRSSSQLPSPLGANPPEQSEGKASDGERVKMSGDEAGKVSDGGQKKGENFVGDGSLQKAFDDIELDLKKWNVELVALQEKADAFIQGLEFRKSKK